MSASNGETITVGPAPWPRSSAVATKYTADLPQPVRWTTSARRRSATSAGDGFPLLRFEDRVLTRHGAATGPRLRLQRWCGRLGSGKRVRDHGAFEGLSADVGAGLCRGFRRDVPEAILRVRARYPTVYVITIVQDG